MARISKYPARCDLGIHRPSAKRWRDGETVRTHCTACGGQLFRLGANRRWIFSGLLGDTAPRADTMYAVSLRPAEPGRVSQRAAG